MPQNRRKVPFSGKQKKLQKQQKQVRKRTISEAAGECSKSSDFGVLKDELEVINKQPGSCASKTNPNRYNLVFRKEAVLTPQERLQQAQIPFHFLPEESLEISFEEVFDPGSELDLPKRPPWKYNLSKDALELQEQKYFRDYVSNLEMRCSGNISHFDLNLENWRQLWRVLEFSDIILLVTDIRHPVFHFSPALYDYVTKDLQKDIILVLNKIDLVSAPLVVAWKDYFKKRFPKIHIMCFASYAGMKVKEGKQGKRIGKLRMAVAGVRHLQQTCQTIVGGAVDLSEWKEKIDCEAAQIGSTKSSKDQIVDKMQVENTNDTSYYNESRYKDGILTLGFVGHPNVGKSSFLNAVIGKKVTSVSRTPGHTKHYQTIWLTPTVRLCDCPGLVFPSLAPRAMQVLMGCYPIAQVKDPYSVMQFLSQRVPVPQILRLKHPDYDADEPDEVLQWSAYDICEGWAIKRGFFTARAARPDVYRAANGILRMALDGRTICLVFYPKNYVEMKDSWQNHPDVKNIKSVQAPLKCGVIGEEQEEPSDYSEESDCDKNEPVKNESSDNSEEDEVPMHSASRNKFSMLSEIT